MLKCILSFSFLSYQRKLIGSPAKKTKHAALFVMLKNHSLIEEGELRPYYLVFEHPCDMAHFLVHFIKDAQSTGGDERSLPSDDEDDLETSFESQNSELSDLFPDSQDVFADNAIAIDNQAMFKGSHKPSLTPLRED